MNRSTHRLAQATAGTGSLWMLLAAAPFAAAQTPGAPNAATAPPAVTAPPAAPAADDPEHVSYLFGLTFGEQMHAAGIGTQVSPDGIARGIKDGLQGKKSTREDQQRIQEFVRSAMVAAAARNKAAAQDFLAKNGHDKGIKTTASGLQYKILSAGDAKAPAVLATDDVTVNYRGKLLDGTEFDSSYARNSPATFKVNGVIKGWQEALVLMKPGAKWQLFIPPDLAYGDSPRPGIPAGSLLLFDVELLSVKPSAAQAPAEGRTMPPAQLPGKALPPQSHKAVAPLNPAQNP